MADDVKGMNEGVDNDTRGDTHGTAKPKKKPYTPPVLIDWGTLADLTQAVGWSGKKDGGRFLVTKTR